MNESVICFADLNWSFSYMGRDSPELIEQKKIEKWNGDVPTVSGSGASIVNIGDIGNEVNRKG